MIPFTPQDFRTTMSHFASGVTVVTTLAKDGTYHGITVSSFTSVSLNPPLVLICIDKNAAAHQILPASGFFCVNFLHEDQVNLSNRFAGRDPQRSFDDIPLITSATGAPVFAEGLGFVDCRISNTYDGGDHTIFLGEVIQLGAADPVLETGEPRSPLIYYKSNYRFLKP
ncbi:MAG: putative flavin reductase [Chloroflexi bacterium]|nr:putative flavin reductase [Chloroflexota bacterium]